MAYSGSQYTRLGLSGISRGLYGSFAGKTPEVGGYPFWAVRNLIEMDRTLEDTFYLRFHTKNMTTGAPATLSGAPVVSAYEDGSATQITAGITLGVDHDTVTGLNLLTIVATAANGYEAGKDYDLVITTGTVGGISLVGDVVGHFSLGLGAAFARIGAAGAGLTNINLPNQTMDITGNLSGSVGSVTGAVGSVTGHTAQTGDTYALANGATGFAAIDTVVDAILADTADMQPRVAAIEVDTGTTLDAALAVVDANVDAILVDTGTTIPATIATVDANVDAILVDTGTTLPATLGTPADTDLATDLANIAADIPSTRIAVDVTFSGGTTTTAVLTNVNGAAASAVNDFYNGRVLIFNSGTLANLATDIIDYDGATATATITTVTTAVTGTHTAVMV